MHAMLDIFMIMLILWHLMCLFLKKHSAIKFSERKTERNKSITEEARRMKTASTGFGNKCLLVNGKQHVWTRYFRRLVSFTLKAKSTDRVTFKIFSTSTGLTFTCSLYLWSILAFVIKWLLPSLKELKKKKPQLVPLKQLQTMDNPVRSWNLAFNFILI